MTDDVMTLLVHVCDRCGVVLDETWPYALCEPCGKLPCPHGNKHGACDQCDLESDRAFDAWREDL